MLRLKSIAKRLMPKAWVDRVTQYRAQRVYEQTRRSYYLRQRLAEFGQTTDAVPQSIPPCSILFVCFGNIMRSPMCEALMKRATSDRVDALDITSAGLNAIPGRSAHPWSVSAAAEFGISLEGHRARALTSEMVEGADLIFAMDFQNRMEIVTRFPGVAERVFMLGEFRGSESDRMEIHDPYHLGEDATRHCYRVLDICIRNLALRIPRCSLTSASSSTAS